MTRVRGWLAGFVALVVAGACSSVASPPLEPPPPPPGEERADPGRGSQTGAEGGTRGGVALPGRYEIVSNVLIPTESYLPRPGGMPTGLVLLAEDGGARNRRLCDALLGARTATVRTEAEARREDPRGDYLVTHWPVRTAVADEGDCVRLMAAYDFERASRVRGAYGLQDLKGPVFLGLDATGEIVFLDLSNASPQEVFKATDDWMESAIENSSATPAAGASDQVRSIAGSARTLFGRVFGGRPAETLTAAIRFNDPRTGLARSFNLYRAGVLTIGTTFQLT